HSWSHAPDRCSAATGDRYARREREPCAQGRERIPEGTMTASGLSLVDYQDAITAYVKLMYPGYEVIEDTLDDDTAVRRDFNGKMDPYIILRYGPMMPKRRGRSFKGALHDEY